MHVIHWENCMAKNKQLWVFRNQNNENILLVWAVVLPNRPVDPVAVLPKRPVPVCVGVAVPNPVVAVVLAPKILLPVPKPVLYIWNTCFSTQLLKKWADWILLHSTAAHPRDRMSLGDHT